MKKVVFTNGFLFLHKKQKNSKKFYNFKQIFFRCTVLKFTWEF